MRPFIELYIDNEMIEFSEPPQILFTYAHTELHNPTVVKNSFSKTLTIDGTPKNNRIFGCFGDMSRVVSYGDGKYLGTYFNPSRKVDFVLKRNGEPIERGYVKLDKVVKQGKQLKYEITLYGGLGQMLYNLQYREDGEQMKLSDLEYGTEFNMEINKHTVRNAWQHLTNPEPNVVSSFYDTINFAPCYNGIPQDFNADKIAIYADGLSISMREKLGLKLESGAYKTVNGWMLGELAKEYDEWQTKDLRSYLQRPVIRFKKIIDACCDPINNGGYEVDLDTEFFSKDNPYYENAWMTLPLVSEMEVEGKFEDENVNITDDGNGNFSLSGLKNGDMFSTSLNYFLASNADVELQTNGYGYTLTTGAYTFNRDTPLISANMAIYSQLVVYDKDGEPVGGSNVISCSTVYGKYPSDFKYDLEFDSPVTLVNGRFYYEGTDGYRYRFWDDLELGSYVGGNKHTFELNLKNVKYSDGMYLKFVTKTTTIDNGTVLGNAGKLFWSEGYDAYTAEPNMLEKWGIGDITKTYKKMYISKELILNSENTPCDYFLNYLKMFNLHIWADNFDKKVYIRQRKNYFSDDRVNIDKLVDRGSEINITPITFDAKYYVFNSNIESDSYLNKRYKDNYGFDYGIQKIDTNYNFDNSSKDLIENGVLKGCVCQRGKSRYYVDAYLEQGDYRSIPPCFLDGCNTFLFNGEGDTTDGGQITPKTSNLYSVNWYKEKNYDALPKPDFRDKDGKSVDGANVLLFFNGKVEMDDVNGKWIGFYLTDDIPEFEQLNEGEPCWIYVGSNNGGMYSYDVGALPCFSRYLTNEKGWITHSWDFGTPRELYINGWNIDSSSDIYNQYWKPYMNDELNVNTRMVECKVKFNGKVNPDFLMNFVYFDNAYWLIKEITDYDVTSERPTKVKLVKVNNINNYLT